jgi:photosystem II stability/assembly factor-like uncharacterized protein
VIADMEHDHPGRCSHGGPVCMEYANGDLVAFYANTTDHNLDGWSEYAVSKDKGKTWARYNKFPYSYAAYQADPKQPVWVEEGLVTERGTVVLVLTRFASGGGRVGNGVMRSFDHGATWSEYAPLDGNFTGYPCSVAVAGDTNYVLVDSNGSESAPGPHILYASTDDGRTWTKRSTLPLDAAAWYGALCVGEAGRLVAGAYMTADENHFYTCASGDGGRTWTRQALAYVDKKVRDPELAYLGGKYYLHGRAGSKGETRHTFVLYQSDDGMNWKPGVIVSGDTRNPDGYSNNCIVNRWDPTRRPELMVLYSIIYAGRDTNEYVFFVKPAARP